MSTRRRHDPRAERLGRTVAGQEGRVRLLPAGMAAPQVSPAGRIRRDPRAERARMLVNDGSRPRIVRDGRGGGGAPSTARRGGEKSVIRVDDPKCLIMVVPDLPDGRLGRLDRQVLGAARMLADAGDGAVMACCPADMDQALQHELGQAGVDRLLPLPLAATDPEQRTHVLCEAMAALSPRQVLFGESPDGSDLARRVAVATGRSFMGDVESLNARQAIRPFMARRREMAASVLPGILALAPDRVAAYEGTTHEARLMTVDMPEPLATRDNGSRLHVAPSRPGDPATMSLAEAPFVVSAGNGVTDFDAFRQVVAALYASPGGSRMVCDAGLLPREIQVGASGTVLDAVCYLALGISGAPQHLQGLGRVEHVVAVNTDLHAAMIGRAGLAIIADAQQVMPALMDLLHGGKEA
ncbi:electron transfer flavoprotein subunit alpha/FixB family protein [Komagataeibacter sp. FNDCF1]|uniref:electron transfer flavoprotein subunit alpha/FixB family protein n=1 Tax=Komagataeibacter sp. FNDCF1 TaxID=2878681 RepID=UPI001E50D845|nr:electron transfer flavoprotein subunit alpha/FixB family protein [Komagataeibacter sp. FNDCF1]MCE2565133.1 electron transfer flavoprotein subunit alpha/FixB family protein [Komagataeibacter sp. FNDCF1]